MPFVGREAAIQVAAQSAQFHAQAAELRSIQHDEEYPRRSGNERLFAVGAPGVGKTRFGLEFPSLLRNYIDDKTIQAKLAKTRIIHITFQNDRGIQPDTDQKWKTPQEQVDWILTSRAIYAVYEVKEAYEKWAPKLAAMLGEQLPADFNMNSFSEKLLATDKPTTLYYFLDEVQEVLRLGNAGAVLVRTLSKLYHDYNTSKVLTLLLFAGTILTDIVNLQDSMNVGRSPEFPIVALPMETLTEEQTYNLIDTMYMQCKLPWLSTNWKANSAFLKLLAYTGGVPRMMEQLFDVCALNSNLNTAANELTSAVIRRYSLSVPDTRNPLLTACYLALSGKTYELTEKVPGMPKRTIENLRALGVIFFNSNQNVTIPFIYLRIVLENLWKDGLTQDIYYDKIIDLWTKISMPYVHLSWENFEAFTLVHTMLRGKALLKLGYSSTTLKDYFSSANVISTNIELLKINIRERIYVELQNRWPNNENQWPVARIANQSLHTEQLLGSIVLNASGSPFDGFEFVEVSGKRKTKKYALLAHQYKHITEGGTKLTFKKIAEAQNKINSSIEKWKQLDSGDKELQALKKSITSVITVIYTNRQITGTPLMHTNLAVICNPEHFGPFKSFIKFFSK